MLDPGRRGELLLSDGFITQPDGSSPGAGAT
jgi:hypothetical protein